MPSAVHFLCGHSFNLRTLGDGDAACPLCAGEHRKAQELRRSNRASAADKVSCGSDAAALRGAAKRAPARLGCWRGGAGLAGGGRSWQRQ